MKVNLREEEGIILIAGAGFAKNMYNLSNGKEVTKWFDSITKDRLLKAEKTEFKKYFSNNLYKK